ncbi:MAG: hypothetical protein EHM65_06845, partial [Acidobacteriales bacterium]
GDDVVLRALADELDRSRSLRLVALEVPYYIEYGIHDADSFAAGATLGAINLVRKGRARLPRVQVRVGDYKFDNGNYVFSDYRAAGGYDLGACPLDDNYMALRQYFWLGTDVAYKSALEIIARKRAAQKNVTVTEQLPDLSRIEPVTMFLTGVTRKVDEEAWKSRLRSLSSLFAPYSQIISSSADFQMVQGYYYLVTSEGTRIRVPEGSAHFEARAMALASDGMTLRDSIGFHTLELDALPGEPALRRAVQSVADNLEALLKAPVGEAYTGPVLFEPEAAAQLMAEVLGRSFALRRRPVSEPGRAVPFVASDFEGRMGSRVLPDWMEVTDDPTLEEWNGRKLLGHYLVDLEGVAPKSLTLVEKGLLRNFLTTRQPMRGVEGSNGRARLRGSYGANAAAFSNLFVRASETSTLPELKNRLIQLCEQTGKPYGLLIRKMDFPSSASVAEAQRLLSRIAQDGASARPVSSPLLAYRVYADGREELVRGLRFKDLTVRSLRDIIAAGGEPAQFDFLENGATFALMGAGSFVAESSVISPGVLIEELQLVKAQDEWPKLPIVAPPTIAVAR